MCRVWDNSARLRWTFPSKSLLNPRMSVASFHIYMRRIQRLASQISDFLPIPAKLRMNRSHCGSKGRRNGEEKRGTKQNLQSRSPRHHQTPETRHVAADVE